MTGREYKIPIMSSSATSASDDDSRAGRDSWPSVAVMRYTSVSPACDCEQYSCKLTGCFVSMQVDPQVGGESQLLDELTELLLQVMNLPLYFADVTVQLYH